MARSKTSEGWLKEHFDDHYVQQAQKLGYRSRACFKLLEIQDRTGLIRPGDTVLDLGSAPGGWSQVAAELVGDQGRVVASDILWMDNLAGVEFLQGDFTEQAVFEELLHILDGQPVDLVLSDMAPNMSGMKAVDQPQAMYLVELALELAVQVLKPGGTFLAKVFQGQGFVELNQELRKHFNKVQSKKPKASRPRSREVYQLATGFKG